MNKKVYIYASAFVVVIGTVFSTLTLTASIAESDTGGRPLHAVLTGDAEVPGPGDPDGSGFAAITLNSGQEEICFDITVLDIVEPTAAHIHVGTADVAGPVVVNFQIGANGLSGCVSVDQELIKEIRKNPSNYYVNVHNAEYPGGAIRGQLSK